MSGFCVTFSVIFYYTIQIVIFLYPFNFGIPNTKLTFWAVSFAVRHVNRWQKYLSDFAISNEILCDVRQTSLWTAEKHIYQILQAAMRCCMIHVNHDCEPRTIIFIISYNQLWVAVKCMQNKPSLWTTKKHIYQILQLVVRCRTMQANPLLWTDYKHIRTFNK